jgi:hypothetical protein
VINHRVFQVTEHHHGRDAKFRQPGEGVTGHELTGIGTPRRDMSGVLRPDLAAIDGQHRFHARESRSGQRPAVRVSGR